VYPGGAAGFDPSHPAAKGTVISTVASGANHINLLTGQAGSTTGSVPTAVIDGHIGPAMNCLGFEFSTFAGAIPPDGGVGSAVTLAAIFTRTSASTLYSGVCQTGAGNTGFALNFYGSNVLKFEAPGAGGVVGNATAIGSITLLSSVPYFVAASYSQAIATVNFVVTNLLTGQIQTQVVTGATGTPLAGGTYYAGYAAGSYNSLGPLATTMASYAYTILPQLVKWAQRPWDFWRPPTVTNLIFSSLRAPLIAGHKRSFGTFMGRP
jgi:hypothetical protein